MNELQNSIIDRLRAVPGTVGYYFEDLTTGETAAYNENAEMVAASVIKLTIMAELYRQIEAGEVDRDQKIAVRDCDRVPICGVLTMMHEGMEVTPIDLCSLMITISDNMATNLLIDLLGLEKIQQNNVRLGLDGVYLRRKLFERRPGFEGKYNRITVAGIARLLRMIWRHELVSPAACDEMLQMLTDQQCINKMPLLLPGEGLVAHKTGEVETVSHDVGILLCRKPCLVCFMSTGLEEGREGDFNVLVGQITRDLWNAQGGLPEA